MPPAVAMVAFTVPPPMRSRLPDRSCIEPLLRLSCPDTVEPGCEGEAGLIESEPLLISRFAVQSRLSTVSVAVVSCVTVMPGSLMTTSSDDPGNAPVLQLDGVSQSPPLRLVQVTVESSVRSSSWLSAGRKPGRRYTRRRMGTTNEAIEFGDDRRNFRRMGASPGLKRQMKDQMRKSSTRARRPSAGPIGVLCLRRR